jgi:hypothetical protein
MYFPRLWPFQTIGEFPDSFFDSEGSDLLLTEFAPQNLDGRNGIPFVKAEVDQLAFLEPSLGVIPIVASLHGDGCIVERFLVVLQTR